MTNNGDTLCGIYSGASCPGRLCVVVSLEGSEHCETTALHAEKETDCHPEGEMDHDEGNIV